MERMIYNVWLAECLGVESKFVVPIFSYFGSAENVFRSDERDLRLSGLFSRRELQNILRKDLSGAQKNIDVCHNAKCQILGFDDAAYPERLRAIESPPVVLYVQGDFPESLGRSIAIVGTRHASSIGKKLSFQIAYDLAKEGVTIVSGGADGIDTHAHLGALQADGSTICVLGCGISYPYLTKFGNVRQEIVRKGVLISEYSPDTAPSVYTFPKRNRIVAALTDSTLVVEADLASGALITAVCAAKEKKPIFAVPGNVRDKQASGTNFLLRNGAYPVIDATDIIRAYQNYDIMEAYHLLPFWEVDNARNLAKKSGKNGENDFELSEQDTDVLLQQAYERFSITFKAMVQSEKLSETGESSGRKKRRKPLPPAQQEFPAVPPSDRSFPEPVPQPSVLNYVPETNKLWEPEIPPLPSKPSYNPSAVSASPEPSVSSDAVSVPPARQSRKRETPPLPSKPSYNPSAVAASPEPSVSSDAVSVPPADPSPTSKMMLTPLMAEDTQYGVLLPAARLPLSMTALIPLSKNDSPQNLLKPWEREDFDWQEQPAETVSEKPDMTEEEIDLMLNEIVQSVMSSEKKSVEKIPEKPLSKPTKKTQKEPEKQYTTNNIARERLTGVTLTVYDTISDAPIVPEHLVKVLNLTPGEVLSALTELEMLGYIIVDSYGRYIKILN